MEMIEKAQRWSQRGHDGVYRKFTDLPYIVHPEAVAEIVSQLTDDSDVISAAWLHDYVEDVDGATLDQISESFNPRIAQLVGEVSGISKKSDGNREKRKRMDKNHYAKASKWGKVIKLADIIHNLPTMIRDSPEFAPVYVHEKEELLEVIRDGSPLLSCIIDHIIEDFKRSLTPLDVYSKIKKINK